MTRRRCCCGCLMYSDKFNRAESSVLGLSWYEPPSMSALEIDWYCPVGTPTSSHGALHLPAGYAGAALWTRPHLNSVFQMHNRIYVLDDDDLFGTAGEVELHLAVEYDPDTQAVGGMHIARLVYGPDDQRIDLITRNGYSGAEKILASTGPSGMTAGNVDPERSACGTPSDTRKRRLFTATINENAFCATIENAPVGSVFAAPDWTYYGAANPWYGGVAASSLAGTGTGSGMTEPDIWMDNWELWKTYDTDTDCPYCTCKCNAIAMPQTLVITIRSAGCMGVINGSTASLSWDYDEMAWVGTMATACATFNFRLQCPPLSGNEPSEYALEVSGECLDSDPCGDTRMASVFSTCDPLWLVFGCTDDGSPDTGTGALDCDHDPWRVAKSDLACGCCTPDIMGSGYHGWFCFEVTE